MSLKNLFSKPLSKDVYAYKNGVPVVVGRPAHEANKKAAIEAGKAAIGSADPKKLQEAIDLGSPYVVLGYLSKDGSKILDDKGRTMPTVLEPGDAFLDPRGVQKIGRAEP